MFARVAILSPPYATLDYSAPSAFPASFWRPGLRLLVPVGKTIRAGVLISLADTSALAADRCRSIIWPLEKSPIISPEVLELACHLASHQGSSPGQVLSHALPATLRQRRIKLSRKFGEDPVRAITQLSDTDYAALAKALLQGKVRFLAPSEDIAALELLSLHCDPPWPVRPSASMQRAILDLLQERGQLSRRQLLRDLGPGAAAPLNKLIAAHLVATRMDAVGDEAPEPRTPPGATFALNESQRQAVAAFIAAQRDGETCRLLYGVTGSGKTAVYMELVRHCLELGGSVLLMAPEVALAHKLFRDVEQALPGAPRLLYHGYQPPGQRAQTWRELAENPIPRVIVGTRSAIFLPISQLACIVMDEEHDGSYKQSENFVYHARDMAWLRAKQGGSLLVLGSATPDLRTFYASEQGVIPRQTLSARVSGAAPPPVELAPLGAQAGKDGNGLLAEFCVAALEDCLRKGEQAVILLNRRGYAPLVWCVNCNEVIRCPHCQIGMAYHKKLGKLACHFCGHSIPWPSPCPHCGDTNFVALGEGTERLAERLEAIAGRPVLRLDRDNVRRPGRIEEILAAFGKGESPFLVGTQMLSKGHHFPNVTLAVVADGDIGLNLPDYRAAERTFQMLVQAAGRAGRGSKPGRAIIQTRQPDHYCWKSITSYDYEAFYAAEMERRRRRRYPPFVRLGLLRLSFPVVDDDAANACAILGRELKSRARTLKLNFYGPVPAPLAIIQGRKRFHCLMKAADWEPMRQMWFFAQKINKCRQLRIFLDLDPVDMM